MVHDTLMTKINHIEGHEPDYYNVVHMLQKTMISENNLGKIMDINHVK